MFALHNSRGVEICGLKDAKSLLAPDIFPPYPPLNT